MSQQYDVVADKYDLSFQAIPYRLYIEAYSVFKALGDVAGLDIFDLATGTGYYARELRRRGARRVVGVDIAAPMVEIAKQAEQQEPLDIAYFVQDAAEFVSHEPFDIGLAVYLLHYAPDYDHLLRMCNAISTNLKSGSRFVTYQLNPDLAREPGYYEQYGLSIKVPETLVDGSPVPFTVTVNGMTLPEVAAYWWSKATLEKALSEAGLTDIQWSMPEVSPSGVKQYGEEIWQTYLTKPHCVLVECVKG